MANYITCTNKIEFPTVIMSLWAYVQSLAGGMTPEGGLRITASTADTPETFPLDCNNKDSFEDLVRRCIVVGTDNYPAIRYVITDYVNGSGIAQLPTCKTVITDWKDLARMAFVRDANGDVCFNFLNIT